MTKNIIIFVVLILVVVFHLAFLPNFSWWQNKFSLITIFIGLLALRPNIKGFIWIMLAGFIIDCFSGTWFSVYLITFLITGLIIHLLSKKVFSHQTPISTIFLVGIVSTISVFVLLAIVNFFVLISDLNIYWFYFKGLSISFLWQLLFNTVIASFAILITSFFKNRFSNSFIVNYDQ